MQDFIYNLRIQIEDSDYAGVAYHANYLKFFERARSEWMHQNGFGLGWQKEHGVLFAITHVAIDYLKPAYLDDCIEIISDNVLVRKVGITIDQHIRLRNNPEKILTRVTTKLACISAEHKLRRIPEELTKELEK